VAADARLGGRLVVRAVAMTRQAGRAIAAWLGFVRGVAGAAGRVLRDRM